MVGQWWEGKIAKEMHALIKRIKGEGNFMRERVGRMEYTPKHYTFSQYQP